MTLNLFMDPGGDWRLECPCCGATLAERLTQAAADAIIDTLATAAPAPTLPTPAEEAAAAAALLEEMLAYGAGADVDLERDRATEDLADLELERELERQHFGEHLAADDLGTVAD